MSPLAKRRLSCSSRDRLTGGDSFSAEVLLCVSRRVQAAWFWRWACGEAQYAASLRIMKTREGLRSRRRNQTGKKTRREASKHSTGEASSLETQKQKRSTRCLV